MKTIEGFNNQESTNKKTKYFSNFALSHFRTMHILKEGGILGEGGEGWRNISEHCLVEAVAADVLAEALDANRELLVEAALIHDWFKRREVEAMKRVGATEGYKVTSRQDESLLTELGVSEDIIKVAHSNIPENAEDEYLTNRSIEEKIMHFIDCITSGSEFVSFKERLEVVKRKQMNIDFSDSFKDKYAGESLYDVQERVASAEQAEFERQLNLVKDSLIDFIKDQIQKRIDSVEF